MIGLGVFCLFSSASYLLTLSAVALCEGAACGRGAIGGFVGCRNKLLFGYYYERIMGRHQTVSSWHLLIPSSSALSFWTKHYYWVIISDVPLLYSTQLSIGHSITQKCFSLSLSIAQLTWMESCGYGTLSRFNFIFISPFDCYSIRRKMLMKHTL